MVRNDNIQEMNSKHKIYKYIYMFIYKYKSQYVYGESEDGEGTTTNMGWIEPPVHCICIT